MTENSATVTASSDTPDPQTFCNCVYEMANVLQVPSTDENMYYFASKTYAAGVDALVTLKVKDDKITVTVNCEKMVIGSMLVKDLKAALAKVWFQ